VINESKAPHVVARPERHPVSASPGQAGHRSRVVGDVRHTALENGFTGEVYFPLNAGVDLSR